MKETKQLTVKICQKLWKKLDAYCIENGVLKGFAIEQAVKEWMDKRVKK
jgi:hypothetical protein